MNTRSQSFPEKRHMSRSQLGNQCWNSKNCTVIDELQFQHTLTILSHLSGGEKHRQTMKFIVQRHRLIKRLLPNHSTIVVSPPTTTHTQVGIPRKSITRGCIILHFYQQCVSVPVAPYSIQHLVWSLFNFSHSNSLWWYLIVIFNLFSPDDY